MVSQTLLEASPRMEYDYQDLLDLFSERELKHGADYINKGKVENVRRSQLGNIITGRVVAATSQQYRLFIEVVEKAKDYNGDHNSDNRRSSETLAQVGVASGRSSNRSNVEIATECTCEANTHCKHAAAVLLQNLAELGRAPIGLGGSDDLLGQVDDWLGELEALDRDVLPDELPEDVSHQLAYFISTQAADGLPEISVSAIVVNSDQDGKVSELIPFKSAASLQSGFFPRYVTSEDSHLVQCCDRLCSRFRFTGRMESIATKDEARKSFELIKRLAETGRAYWVKSQNENGYRQALRGKPLKWINRRVPGRMMWAVSGTGAQKLVPVADDFDLLVVAANPPIYYDREKTRLGTLNVGLNESTLQTIYSTVPDISPDVSSPSHDAPIDFGRFQPLFDLPEMVPPARFKRVPGVHVPHGKIVLHSTQLSSSGGVRGRMATLDLASVRFVYVDRYFSSKDDDAQMLKYEQGNLVCFTRNFLAESQLRAELAPLKSVEDHLTEEQCLGLQESEYCLANSAGWKRFMIVHVPRLRALGWEIEVHNSFRHRYARVDQWQLQVDEKGDWFELSMGIHVNGQWRDLFPILTNYLQQVSKKWRQTVLPKLRADEPVFIRLEGDVELAISAGRIRHILATLVELFDERLLSSSGKLDLPTSQFMRINELMAVAKDDSEIAFAVEGSEHLHQLAVDLKSFNGLSPVMLPDMFQGNLRSYQQEGVNWLQFLRHYHLGGVLADDMGLGKTIQTIAHLTVEKCSGRMERPVLVVAPTSLMGNWRSEIERFAPDLSVLSLHGTDRKSYFDQIQQHDIVMTTYPLLVRDQKVLQEHLFYYVILDEAQLIKNVRAKVSKIVRKLNSDYRLCLTGTPMENHLGELWSLFDFLMPGFLGLEKQFRKLYRNPIEKYGDEPRRIALSRRVSPFMLRRTKEEVASELPPKSEFVCPIEILGEQRDFYESIRVSLNQRVQAEIAKRGLASSQLVILDSLLKLRQVCCDPRLVKLDTAVNIAESAKLEYLLSMTSQLVEEGRKILIFSQFTSMLTLIGEALNELKLPFLTLTGKTKDRDKVINEFQSGEFPVFLISLKAGGTGLNLTAADTVIHYDPWWNPAVERQATDRAYRIGQDKPVFVYKLIGKGTVEEKIQALQQRKRALTEGLLSESTGDQFSFSEEDLAILFEPLV